MKTLSLTLFLLIGLCTLGACAAPGETVSPHDLSTATPTPGGPENTPTATIDWFPVEDTATPFPTSVAAPTLDSLLGRGAQSLSDDFSDPNVWQSAKTAGDGGNNIIVNRNRLTTAINIPPAYIFSLRRDVILKDFYAEVTVSLNRCSVGDSYGMLFHAQSNQDTYRYTLGCNGQVRIERLKANTLVPIQNWLPSGDVPPAAPGEVTMGIWFAGVEMRFFLNGHYQFNVIDPVFRFGTLGLFASGTSPNGLNISFSDLKVDEVDYVSPTPTSTPRKTVTPTRTPRE